MDNAPLQELDSRLAKSAGDSDETSRPTVQQALTSRTSVAHFLAALFMLSTLLLPLSRGCNGVVSYPVDQFSELNDSINVSSVLFIALYGFGVIASLGVGILAVSRRRSTMPIVFWITWSLVVVIFCWSLIAFWMPDVSVRDRWMFVGACVPPFMLCCAWILAAVRHSDFVTAWGRLLISASLGLIAYMQVLTLFSTGLIGYYVYHLSMILLLIANQWFVLRFEHDFIDRCAKARRFQWSVKSVMLWTAVVAISIAYYASIDKLIDYLCGVL